MSMNPENPLYVEGHVPAKIKTKDGRRKFINYHSESDLEKRRKYLKMVTERLEKQKR